MMAGPPAYDRAKDTTTDADASRQSLVKNGDKEIIRGIQPAAAYLVGQFSSPVRPHCNGLGGGGGECGRIVSWTEKSEYGAKDLWVGQSSGADLQRRGVRLFPVAHLQ